MTTHHIARPKPNSSTKLSWLLTMGLSVSAIVLALTYASNAQLGASPLPIAAQLEASSTLLRYSAQLTTQSLNDKQRLLDSYAYTLGQIDPSDGLAMKKWLHSHGDLVSRLFAETRLVLLPSALVTPLQSSWLLRPGQAAVAAPLEGSIAAQFNAITASELTASIAISYLIEQGVPQIVHTSPALNKYGEPVAVLIALTPASEFLSLKTFSCLHGAKPPYAISMPSQRTVLGPFITTAHKQLLASPTGCNSQQLETLLNRPPTYAPSAGLIAPHPDFLWQWQAIPGTTWQVGLAIAHKELPTSAPSSWLDSMAMFAVTHPIDWTVAGLALLLVAAGLLAWWRSRHQSRNMAKANNMPQAPPVQTGVTQAPTSSVASEWLTPPPERLIHVQAPTPSPPHRRPSSGMAPPTLSVSIAQLKHSHQCFILLRHGKVLAMSQGAMDFLQLNPTQPTPRTIQSLLTHPEDYERLHILIDAAAQNALPFSFNIELSDALGFHHAVFAQAFPPCRDAQHQRLVLFEAELARLARLCPSSLMPDTPPELDPISLLPTFHYWHALLQGLLRLNELACPSHLDGSTAESAQPAGYVLYLAIDGFASLANIGGQSFSDEALRYTANTLTNALSQHPYRHVLGHLHNEQFALACMGIDRQQALLLAKQLQHAIAHMQASYQSVPMLLSISIGLATLPQQLSALDTHLNAADLACFDAAAKGLAGLEIAKPIDDTQQGLQ